MSASRTQAKKIIKLHLLKANRVVRTYKVKANPFTIGSGEGRNVRIANPAVLDTHATVYEEDGEITLIPESGAATTLNGNDIDFAVVGPDDVLAIGKFVFKLELSQIAVRHTSKAPSIPTERRPSVSPQVVPIPRPSITPPQVSKQPSSVAPLPQVPVPRPSKLPVPANRLSTPPEKLPSISVAPMIKKIDSDIPSVAPKEAAPKELSKKIDLPPNTNIDEATLNANDYFYDDSADELEDEFTFEAPFDLADVLLKKRHTVESEARSVSQIKENYCVAHVVRLVDGQVAETLTVQPNKKYKTISGSLRCQLKGLQLLLNADTQVAGQLRKSDVDCEFEKETLSKNRRISWLNDGDGALLGEGRTTYKIEVYRPAKIDRRGETKMNGTLLTLLGVAFVLHIVAGVFSTFLMSSNDEIELTEEQEIFAEAKIDKPLEQQEKPEEIKQEDTLELSEHAPKVGSKTVKRIREKKQTTSSSVSNLLTILSRNTGKKGASNELKDLITNVDAVRSSGKGGVFNVAGVIGKLPGDGVNIAREGGGGILSALKTDNGEGTAVAALQKKTKKRKVRGKVTKMSSSARVKGSLSKAEVTRVINSHIHAVQACYERALLANPSISGRIVFDWIIKKNGRVKGVRVRSSSLGNSQVATCISKRIQKWKFPRPTGGEVTITYPFLFRSVS